MTTQLTTKDPVCGMNVSPEDSRHSEYDGTTYYFCSDGCQQKFASDPAGVLASRAEKHAEKADVEVHSCCHAGHHVGGKSTAVKADDSPEGSDLHLPDAP